MTKPVDRAVLAGMLDKWLKREPEQELRAAG